MYTNVAINVLPVFVAISQNKRVLTWYYFTWMILKRNFVDF